MKVYTSFGLLDVATGKKEEGRREDFFLKVVERTPILKRYDEGNLTCYELVPAGVSVVVSREGDRYELVDADAERIKREGEEVVENFLLAGVDDRGRATVYYAERRPVRILEMISLSIRKLAGMLMEGGMNREEVGRRIRESLEEERREVIRKAFRKSVLSREFLMGAGAALVPEDLYKAQAVYISGTGRVYAPIVYIAGASVKKNTLAKDYIESDRARRVLDTNLSRQKVEVLLGMGVFLNPGGEIARSLQELNSGVVINRAVYEILGEEEKAVADSVYVISNLISYQKVKSSELLRKETGVALVRSVSEKLSQLLAGNIGKSEVDMLVSLAARFGRGSSEAQMSP